MTRLKPARTRYYFDADVLGLAHVVADLRPDVTYPGFSGGVLHHKERPACIITTPKTLDPDWIPLVSAQGWLIITKDRHIQSRLRELQAVREHGARMIALSGVEAIGTFNQLEILMCRWRDIQGVIEEPGPFIYRASRTSFRAIDLHPKH